MKKELTFYEFVALIIPSVIFLCSINYFIAKNDGKPLFDLSNIGDSAVFLCFCYGLGHIIQSLGNIFELALWWIYGGMPTRWLLKKNRFDEWILDKDTRDKVAKKIKDDFNPSDDKTDFALQIYSKLNQKQQTGRIDTFNGNYSLFRGLVVAVLLITAFLFYKHQSQYAFIALFCAFLLIRRMIRFAKHYAKEIYRCYLHST